jgi:hypothetical protein
MGRSGRKKQAAAATRQEATVHSKTATALPITEMSSMARSITPMNSKPARAGNPDSCPEILFSARGRRPKKCWRPPLVAEAARLLQHTNNN